MRKGRTPRRFSENDTSPTAAGQRLYEVDWKRIVYEIYSVIQQHSGENTKLGRRQQGFTIYNSDSGRGAVEQRNRSLRIIVASKCRICHQNSQAVMLGTETIAAKCCSYRQ